MHLATQYCLPFGQRHFSSISDLIYLVDALCDSRLCILSQPKIKKFVSKLSFLLIRTPSYIAGKPPMGKKLLGHTNHCRKLRALLSITDTQTWYRNLYNK